MGLAETAALTAQFLAYAILAASLLWFAASFKRYCRSAQSFYLLALSSLALLAASLLLLLSYISSYPIGLDPLLLAVLLPAAQAAATASAFLYIYHLTFPRRLKGGGRRATGFA